MRCPFLREAQVKNCQASTIRKVIVRGHDDVPGELCVTPGHVHCTALRQHHEDHAGGGRCPFLHESLMQYCATSNLTKYIPYSDSSMLKCGSDSHQYCDAYLSAASPMVSDNLLDVRGHSASNEAASVDGIEVPQRLAFSANHLWLDISSEHMFHIGVDGFLANVLPVISEVHFPNVRANALPTVVLRVQSVDLQLVFPVGVTVTSVNNYLRATPDRIRTDPYRAGWLFEGTWPHRSSGDKNAVDPSLFRTGSDAVAWMDFEFRRLNQFVRDQILPSHLRSNGIMLNDGGELQSGFAAQLGHQELLSLFNEFFSPYANWRSQK
jgi:glycine cleavage system H lipoate-binding protein